MDFAAAKQMLVVKTRQVFGELVTFRPMVEGRLKGMADPDRAVMDNVPARFDYLPSSEKIGGSDRFGPLMPIASDNPTLTVAKASLAWQPDKPDQVELSDGRLFSIVRSGQDGNDVAIFYLSKV